VKCLHDHTSTGCPCVAPDHIDCGPVVARLGLYHGHSVFLCQPHLDFWLDEADADPMMEPAELAWA
jgi:hypothetical protein